MDNIGYTRRRQTKQKHNAICVGHQYTCTQTNTNNVNKTWATLTNNWTGKDEPNIVFIQNIYFVLGYSLLYIQSNLFKDSWLLKRGSIHMKFSMIGQEMGDLLMQVTA